MRAEDDQNVSIMSPEEIGAALRGAREAAHISVVQVAERTRLSKAYIDLLEAGDFDALPGVAYVPGFIRNYCKVIQLDPTPLISAYFAQLPEEDIRPDYKFPVQALVPRMAGSMVAMVIVLAALSVYVGWVLLINKGSDDLGTATLTQEQQPLPKPTPKPAPSPTDTANITPQNSTAPDSPAPDSTSSNSPVPDSIVPDSTGQNSAPETKAPDAVNVTEAQATQRQPLQDMIITAQAASWVEIARADGEVIVSKLMREGDQLAAAIGDNLLLSTGNAGGLLLDVAELDPFAAGKIGEVLRDFPLDLNSLKQRQIHLAQ